MVIFAVIASIVGIILAAAVLYLVWKILSKIAAFTQVDVEAAVRQEMRTGREEAAASAKALREEIGQAHKQANEILVNTLNAISNVQKERLGEVVTGMNQVVEKNRAEIAGLKEEVKKTQKEVNDALVALINSLGATQKEKLGEVTKAINDLIASSKLESNVLREKLEAKFKDIQTSNEQKLDEMRKTVDEKLHATLERRLGESFKIVSERLEAVQRGLGEMQNLANGVGDLKRVLTNVKARGTWGEVQLRAILEQVLTPEQYSANVPTKENSRERVEFAVCLPGKNDGDHPVWLPIDAKFPKEDYDRLVNASTSGDVEGTKQATESLIREIERCAKDISDKHINPPMTTDFAIMFLSTEGLYAEVLRQSGMHELLQRKYRIVAAGPTTLAAVLNSLRMGFQSLAIEKRSSEVWRILGAVKTEFGKFGDIIDKVRGQLETATKTLDTTSVRTRAMNRKLNDVSALPQTEAEELLKLGEGAQETDEETPEGDERA